MDLQRRDTYEVSNMWQWFRFTCWFQDRVW